MTSALFSAFVLIVVASLATYRIRMRRRYEKLKVSGGRKAFALNLFDRP